MCELSRRAFPEPDATDVDSAAPAPNAVVMPPRLTPRQCPGPGQSRAARKGQAADGVIGQRRHHS
jgi:hypothetical protein